jgi:hypothetical protein
VPKIGANWFKIKTGDIISFRYKPVDKTKLLRTHTIMVLNSSYPKSLKDGTYKSYLNGLKLEGSNRSIFTSKEDAWELLKKIGWISIMSLEDEIYSIDIKSTYIGTYGATERLYKELKQTPIGKKAQFRSYSLALAKKQAVFYEPIKLPRDKIRILENQRHAKLTGNKLWKNVESEDPEVGLNE